MNTRTGLLIIGDEILNGDTQDSNSYFAISQLRSIGLQVSHVLASCDSEDSIRRSLDFLFAHCDLVISTGGLGPTRDDITKKTVAEYFDLPLVRDDAVLARLQDRYASMGRELNDLNAAQALVPQGSEAIPSSIGTAPIFWIRRSGKHFIALPGVPTEMQFLLQEELLPRLKAEFQPQPVYSHTLHTIGIPESALAPLLQHIEDRMEAEQSTGLKMKLAYLPKLGGVRLVISATGTEPARLEKAVRQYAEEIRQAAGEFVFGEGDTDLPRTIGKLLLSHKATVTTAESCTAGYLAHLITLAAGSSSYFPGGVIAYSNPVKFSELNVDSSILKEYGAVSKETAIAMAEGARREFNTTYAVSTTGLAGPGADEGKQVGTVWIAVSGPEGVVTRKYVYDYSRESNIQMFAVSALDMLRRYILGLKIDY